MTQLTGFKLTRGMLVAYRRDGLSIRENAPRNGMSRKTVLKYLRAFEQAVGDNPDAEAMDTYLQQPVRYDSITL